jgi:hypothetical protein
LFCCWFHFFSQTVVYLYTAFQKIPLCGTLQQD